MKYEAEPGDSIYNAVREAINLAKSKNQDVELVFNGINVWVSQHSFADDIASIQMLKHKLRQLGELES